MLLYRIKFPDSLRVVIEIHEEGSRRILYLDTLKALAKVEEGEALSLLTKIHIRSQGSRSPDTLSFQQISVSAEGALEILPLLAKTGRLFYKNDRVSFDGAHKAKLYWRGEKHGEKACTLSAAMQYRAEEIPLASCEKVFPLWFFWRQTVIPFTSIVPWKWIELFLGGPTLLEGMQKKRFLEEEPPILWKESAPERPLEVFPELVLTDRTGCFANLWMSYPELGRVAFEDLAPSVGGRTRLKEAEASWEKDLLETGYARKVVGHSRYYCAGDKVVQTLQFLLDLGWHMTDARNRRIARQSRVDWQISEKQGAIAIRGRVLFGEKEAPLKGAIQAGGLWVEIDGSSIGILDRKAFCFLPEGEWEEDALVVKRGSIGALLPLLEEEKVLWEENIRKAIEGLKQGASLELSLPDPRFRAELLPYQQKGVDWLAFHHRWGFSALLADEMGLGKTVQVLAFFSRLDKNSPLLIVAPSSLLYHWRSEIERFIPGASVYIHSGPQRVRTPDELRRREWIVTSYATLRLDEEWLSQVVFEAVALDESNAIKTATTQTAKAACRLQAPFKIAITGTPLENRAEELWSQFRFLMPSLFEGRMEFQESGVESIRRKVRPFILRRRKEEVEIELPEKMEQIAWIEMGEEQAALYQEKLASIRSGLLKKVEVEGASAHRMELLEAILRLRQICCDPRLIGSEIRGTKIEHLLGDLGERKVLIYSQFTTMLQLIGKELSASGRSFLYLDGSVSLEQRADRVRQFQEDPSISLFLLSLKAGGVGLNLTAADYVLLFDPWWNEAVEAQAIDRAHRIGQTKKVIAKRYLTPNSIEEKMLRISQEKKGLAEQLLGQEGSNWTEEDWLHLLS